MPTDKDFKMLEKQIKQDKKKLEQMASELKHSYASDLHLLHSRRTMPTHPSRTQSCLIIATILITLNSFY